MLQALECALADRWMLRFGDDSKLLLQVGKPEVDIASSEPEYKTVAHFPVVGCTISHNASVEECFSGCRAKMWRVFLANLGPSLLATELKYQLKWLETAVLSIMAARLVTWPCSVGLAKRLDQTQVHMIAILVNYKHNIGISNEIYYNHRNLLAGKHAAKSLWSVKWAAAVLA